MSGETSNSSADTSATAALDSNDQKDRQQSTSSTTAGTATGTGTTDLADNKLSTSSLSLASNTSDGQPSSSPRDRKASTSSTTGTGSGIAKTTLAHLQSLIQNATASMSSTTNSNNNNNNNTTAAAAVEVDLKQVTAKVATDYAQYLKFENLSDIALVASNVDEMLVRLDELRSLSETIHRESLNTIQILLPQLIQKTAKLQELFLYIEQVEKYINHIKAYVNKLEDRVEQAEKDYQSKNLKKMFDGFKIPLFSKKSLDIPVTQPVKFQPIEVFNTNDYFPSNNEQLNVEDE